MKCIYVAAFPSTYVLSAANGFGVLITSMSNLAPKGSMCETVRLCGPGWWVAGKTVANCLKPKAVRMDMMFVS